MYNQNWQDEMEAELNGRDDYWSEIRAEHQESKEALDAEQAFYFQEDCIRTQDEMEARGGPDHHFAARMADSDFIPF